MTWLTLTEVEVTLKLQIEIYEHDQCIHFLWSQEMIHKIFILSKPFFHSLYGNNWMRPPTLWYSDIDTQMYKHTDTSCNLKAQRDLNCTSQSHHSLTKCCLEEAFPKKIPEWTIKLLHFWLIKPTMRPFCLLTHKLSPLSPRLSPTYDPWSIKALHSSPPIKSIIICGISSWQIIVPDGHVGSGRWGHSDRQNETADR